MPVIRLLLLTFTFVFGCDPDGTRADTSNPPSAADGNPSSHPDEFAVE